MPVQTLLKQSTINYDVKSPNAVFIAEHWLFFLQSFTPIFHFAAATQYFSTKLTKNKSNFI